MSLVPSTESSGSPQQRKSYADDILEAVNRSLSVGKATFATGGELDKIDVGIPSISVKNIGRIAYPLCVPQFALLLNHASQAPYGKGTETLVDITVRRVWQIEADLVTINSRWIENSLPKIVARCCSELGIDAQKMGVTANLYKLLIYEEGGHFKKHRDTEKEPGMFGSLLIQLPAEHTGGTLIVEHNREVKLYDFAANSGDDAYYACFYADCEHVLEPVTQGLRLVLAFNLIQSKVPSLLFGTTDLLIQESLQRLVVAANTWSSDLDAVEKYVFPLSHAYTRTNLSFAALKGNDKKLVDLLQNVIDPDSNERIFKIYLALVTKHVVGAENEDYGARRDYGTTSGDSYIENEDENFDDEGVDDIYEEQEGRNAYNNSFADHKNKTIINDDGRMDVNCDIDIDYKTDKWIGPNGLVSLGSLSIDFDSEVITESDENGQVLSLFGSKPDKLESEGYCGNYAGTLEYWYHSAVLVFWPVAKDFDITLSINPNDALSKIQELNVSSALFADKFARLLKSLGRNGSVIPLNVEKIISLAQTAEQANIVLRLCYLRKRELTDTDVKFIIAAIAKFGYQSMETEFVTMLASQSLNMMLTLINNIRDICNKEYLQIENYSQNKLWCNLVSILENKVARTFEFKSRFILILCRFISTYCDDNAKVKLGQHMCSRLKLDAINEIINNLMIPGARTTYQHNDDVFINQFKLSAIRLCGNRDPVVTNVANVVDWVVRGEDSELMVQLSEILNNCFTFPKLFKKIFSLQSVVTALQKVSAISMELANLIERRIDFLTPRTIPPTLNWSMPHIRNTTGDNRVTRFLSSNQETVEITGFNGIGEARKWAEKYFGNNRKNAIPDVDAVATGTGKNAYVTLTKRRTQHEAMAKECVENLVELHNLQNLLKVQKVAQKCLNPVPMNSRPSVCVDVIDEETSPAQKRARFPQDEFIDDSIILSNTQSYQNIESMHSAIQNSVQITNSLIDEKTIIYIDDDIKDEINFEPAKQSAVPVEMKLSTSIESKELSPLQKMSFRLWLQNYRRRWQAYWDHMDNALITAIVDFVPVTKAELFQIPMMGEKTILIYGDHILATIYAFLLKNNLLELYPRATVPDIADCPTWRDPLSREAELIRSATSSGGMNLLHVPNYSLQK